MRYVFTGAIAAGIVAMLLSVRAVSHALPLKVCGVPNARWSSLKLSQQERYVRCNLAHTVSVRAWVRSHRKMYGHGVAGELMRSHRRIAHKALRTLHQIQDRIYLNASTFGWTGGNYAVRYRIVKDVVCSFTWNGTPCAGSYSVMRVTMCETGDTLLAEPGDDPSSTYKTLFELGAAERAQYGIGLNGNDYHDIHAGVWAQVTSAHNMFIQRGGTWSPWACKADGSVGY